jgi:hypothetical protein
LPNGQLGFQRLEVAPACAGMVDQSPRAPNLKGTGVIKPV